MCMCVCVCLLFPFCVVCVCVCVFLLFGVVVCAPMCVYVVLVCSFFECLCVCVYVYFLFCLSFCWCPLCFVVCVLLFLLLCFSVDLFCCDVFLLVLRFFVGLSFFPFVFLFCLVFSVFILLLFCCPSSFSWWGFTCYGFLLVFHLFWWVVVVFVRHYPYMYVFLFVLVLFPSVLMPYCCLVFVC